MDNVWGEILSEALKLVALIISLLLPILIRKAHTWLNEKIGKERNDQLVFWASTAIGAIENKYIDSGQGEAKKREVIDYIQKRSPVPVSEDDIDMLIESIVGSMNSRTSIGISGPQIDVDDEAVG